MNQHNIKAIIFDCDGTLLHSGHIHYQSWHYALKNQGYHLTEEFYADHLMGMCDEDISYFSATTLVHRHCSAQLLEDQDTHFQKCLHNDSPPIPETLEFLKHLVQHKQHHNMQLAVASGAPKIHIMHHLKNLAIEHHFDAIFSGSDDLSDYRDPEGTNKPKPYIYLKTAKALGVTPRECIAVEDSKSGVAAAVAAGCVTIAIPNMWTKRQDLSQAHLKLDSFEGFTFDTLLPLIAPYCVD